MKNIWLSLISQTKQSYQPDQDQLPQLYEELQFITKQLQLAQDHVTNFPETAQNSKRSVLLLKNQIQKQLRYTIVSFNYKTFKEEKSDYNTQVNDYKRQYLAKFNCSLSMKVGFGLFLVLEDLGEILLSGSIVKLIKDMMFMGQWSDIFQYYQNKQIQVVVDYGY
ncbi:hypothetical protein SS50377_22297 [Spironucleus salmonicida]|uniref:Uncharacterized protein n=1 Tax=Spironucleus salmonicida TaxID=348837 RepID=V6LDA0_9EUKA|nr:hypothetical protein SS50377_22297 [Spironucleus salmonicida]|eukprot:EST42208.1 Hypothetical protein SS50377_18510 [Spironucleus salmonicida]